MTDEVDVTLNVNGRSIHAGRGGRFDVNLDNDIPVLIIVLFHFFFEMMSYLLRLGQRLRSWPPSPQRPLAPSLFPRQRLRREVRAPPDLWRPRR